MSKKQKSTGIKIEHIVFGLIVLFVVAFVRRADTDLAQRAADNVFLQ
jgi:hypothetical protein